MRVGYYVHHQGRGHLHRATAVAVAWHRLTGEVLTGLSTLARPESWVGDWVRLPPDDRPATGVDATAGEQLHWAPAGHRGVLDRAARLSRWLAEACPDLVVVDVSAEAALLTRLHGVPVLSVVLPGRRTDAAHLAAFRASTALVAVVPGDHVQAERLFPGLPDDVRRRVARVGGLSRSAPAGEPVSTAHAGRPRAVLLAGAGGEASVVPSREWLESRRPDWDWTVLGGDAWVGDPQPVLRSCDVVVGTTGQGSVADVASARRPAVLVPQPRPFEEQACTARALDDGWWPVRVASDLEEAVGPSCLDVAATLPAERWARWCDGGAARRFADEVLAAVRRTTQAPAGRS